jgi:uncharacterized membrane protein
MERNKNSIRSIKHFRIISADRLPPPKTLQKYEQIMPGLARMLVENAEQQTLHRLDIERRTLNINNIKAFTGLIFGFLIGIFGMGGGFYLTSKGYNVIGIIFTSSTLVTLVMTFIYGSQSKKNGSHKVGEQNNILKTNETSRRKNESRFRETRSPSKKLRRKARI